MKQKSYSFLKYLSILFIFLASRTLWAGAMSQPRNIYLLETEHFDILFSEPSADTAKLLADNCERLYNMAKNAVAGNESSDNQTSKNKAVVHDLRIPVVISPDSDRLSVDYTFSPYNRIVIFEGVPEKEDNNFQNTLLGLFYHEVYLALSQSVRDPINQFIYKTIGGHGYQPISLFYLPFSFVEGRAFLEEGSPLLNNDFNEEVNDDEKNIPCLYGRFHDKEFLEILSVAKYEGKFPNWIQAGSPRDIYPGKLLNEAAGAAFAAYLMQTYGIEKYAEFWNQCGKVNFKLTSGILKKVYGLSLSDLWDDFEKSVPLPAELEKIKELELKTKSIFKGDTEGLVSNLLISDYGLVWYDDIRHEVDILDLNSTFLMRRLLFLASDVKKLSLSPDGRYLAVSFYGIKSRPEFRNDKVWIYDLQERQFLDINLMLRDGVFVKKSGTDNKSNEMTVAGIYVKQKVSDICIYHLANNKKELIYSKNFPENQYPCDLTFAGSGKVSYILSKNNSETLRQYEFENNIERGWNIFYKGKQVNIRNLRILQAGKTDLNDFNSRNLYTFEYFPPDEPSFTRMGVIVLNDDFTPEEIYFQENDVAGGIKYPAILNNHILFCSDKYTHNEIQYLPEKELSFVKGSFEEYKISENIQCQPVIINNKKIGDYDLHIYNPLEYMINISFVPFMALKDLAVTKKQNLWPSLGGTFITQYDPFMNSRIMLSFSAGYAKLDFSTVSNPTVDDVNDRNKKDVDDNKNISFGISLENTSTPVDIRAGCLFKFNKDGEYNFGVNANGFFQVPIGMAFSNFNFTLHGDYTASTDYYDRNLSCNFPGLSNWPSFNNAYETSKISLIAEYTNIHQYGLSKYEKRGFSLGINFDTFWDITEIKFLNDKIEKLEEELSKGDSSSLTKPQIKKLKRDEMLNISQIVLGMFGEVKIPRLTPFNIINGFVLSVPATIKAEVFNTPGTAVRANAEMLLLGYECQNGFPFLYLYFSRLGIKFGYNLNLNYDTSKVSLPDLRVKDNLWDIFSNIYVRDSIYFIYNMDFSATIGRLSHYHLNLSMKTEYFLRSKGLGFSLNFLVSF